jgi:heat shock protein HspQ
MILINICGSERSYEDLTDSWLYEQISNRQKNGVKVWVKVIVKNENLHVNIVLTSQNCLHSKTVERQTSPHEDELFELWNAMGLKNEEINPNKFKEFLYKIKDM